MKIDIQLERQQPTPHQMIARALFLECHRPLITDLYELDSNRLEFDDTITELTLHGDYVGKSCIDYLNSDYGYNKVINVRNNMKKKLENVIENPNFDDYLKGWDIHLDYESIILDKMVDLQGFPPELLQTKEVNSFFEQNYAFSLLNQGFKLAQTTDKYSPRSQWFSQWTDQWYSQYALTKHRLVDILSNFNEDWLKEFSECNQPQYKNLNEVYEVMKESHNRRRASRFNAQTYRDDFLKENPKLSNYVDFIAISMDYNEELRVMRSVSVHNFMRGCQKKKINAYDEFLRFMQVRKDRIHKEYGWEKSQKKKLVNA